ncbi:reverse transcriptase family protein [Pseudomonas protegens]|uniref:reverse transcriptase family protein n=1 Tax=Pseudomonas protegens TaxID=380021 RepID=UPI0022815333|nr:reverse transcriptase family protein [Pseudomonas protegens]MCY7264484.1 reverse transcriptase family protein [Pseudomonas protegens]
MEAPHYPFKPIYSLRALSLTLGESVDLLESLAKRSSNLYRHVPQTKKDGTPRDTYDAYEPLKAIQRKIVDRLLARVRFPAYLHGGIKDQVQPRSIYSNARVHGRAHCVVLQDIKDFFPSIKTQNVQQLFVGLFGFSKEVADILALLTTRNGVVPQGASSSSYLANLVFWDIEPTLVAKLNAQGFNYSRFADDITITSIKQCAPSALTGIVSAVTNMLSQRGCYQKRSKLHVRKRGQTVLSKNGFEPLTITGLTIFNTVPGIPKVERKAIRAMVKQLEDQATQGATWIKLEPFVRSAMGRVGRLIASGHPDGQRLKQRLHALKAHSQVALIDRYTTAQDSATGL